MSQISNSDEEAMSDHKSVYFTVTKLKDSEGIRQLPVEVYEDEYEIEVIIEKGKKGRHRMFHYNVLWKGYGPKEVPDLSRSLD